MKNLLLSSSHKRNPHVQHGLTIESREHLKELVSYAKEVRLKNEISGTVYSKLVRLIALLYVERMIEEKFETKLDAWTEKFDVSLKRYLENIL